MPNLQPENNAFKNDSAGINSASREAQGARKKSQEIGDSRNIGNAYKGLNKQEMILLYANVVLGLDCQNASAIPTDISNALSYFNADAFLPPILHELHTNSKKRLKKKSSITSLSIRFRISRWSVWVLLKSCANK